MSFQLNGTLFPEGEDSKVHHSGKLRIAKSDVEALVAYLQYAPATANGYTGGEEITLYVKGWRKGRPGRDTPFLSIVVEPAASVVRELQARGKLPRKEEAFPAF